MDNVIFSNDGPYGAHSCVFLSGESLEDDAAVSRVLGEVRERAWLEVAIADCISEVRFFHSKLISR